jgi:hypothetical protein
VEISGLPGVIQVVSADPLRPAASFSLGERLDGVVLKALADQSLILAFGDRQVTARSLVPLVEGQSITVEVVRAGQTVELRLDRPLLPGTPGSGERYALAALLNALGGAPAAAPRAGEEPAALAAWRRVIAARTLFPPLTASAEPEALATLLRTWIVHGGMLLEAHLREAVENPRLTDEQATALWEKDLRVLLGQPREGGEELSRQPVEFAYRWTTTGQAVFTIPMGSSEDPRSVTIVVERDPNKGAAEGRGGLPTTRIAVRVPSETLGVVEARASWRAQSFDALFLVEHEAARERISSQANWIIDSLRPIFQVVSVDVRVDPEQARAPLPALVPAALPARSVVSVRA